MHTVEFRVITHRTGWGDAGPDEIKVIDIVVDGTRLLDLVRDAELPFARREQRERAAEFAPDPAPLLAGAYMSLPGRFGWPNRHLLGQPEEMPWSSRHAAETMLLTCTCGTDECWPLMARVQVTDTVVVWSAFRNVHRGRVGSVDPRALHLLASGLRTGAPANTTRRPRPLSAPGQPHPRTHQRRIRGARQRGSYAWIRRRPWLPD